MVRIEENKIVIEVPCFIHRDGECTWEQLVEMLLALIQDADEDMLQKDELYMAIELLRAMLPKFECGSSQSVVSEI
jgi:hypothetical protein